MPKKKLPKKIIVKKENNMLKLEIVYHELFKAIAEHLKTQAQ